MTESSTSRRKIHGAGQVKFALQVSVATLLVSAAIAVAFTYYFVVLPETVNESIAIFSLAFWLACLIYPIVAYFAALEYFSYLQYCRALKWPSVPGTVVQSGVAEVYVDVVRYFEPTVEYSFIVAGKKLNGFWLGLSWSGRLAATRALAEAETAAVPAGKAIRVAYDPNDPSQNMVYPPRFLLEGKVRTNLIGLAAFILFPFVISGLLLFV